MTIVYSQMARNTRAANSVTETALGVARNKDLLTTYTGTDPGTLAVLERRGAGETVRGS